MSDEHAAGAGGDHADRGGHFPHVNYWVIFGLLCGLTVVSWLADEMSGRGWLNKGIVLTFIVGLLPVVGNLVSNVVIVVVSLSVSIKVAIGSLLFLIVIHKLEYFLNARIVGRPGRAARGRPPPRPGSRR